MKVYLWLVITLGLAVAASAQTSGATYSPQQLDQLLGPIALYPDPLIALILPASTVPSDLQLAASYLAAGGAAAGIDAQPWDPSVKGLARYPEVVKWMNANLDWTHTLGAAFGQQPADVMKSVQQLRAQARAAGTLVNTPQQQVDMEGDDIRIVPAQPNTIYVPQYDPTIVYETPVGDGRPYLSFGLGYPAGAWLGYQLDWDDYGIWMGPWSPGWGYRRDWQHSGRPGKCLACLASRSPRCRRDEPQLLPAGGPPAQPGLHWGLSWAVKPPGRNTAPDELSRRQRAGLSRTRQRDGTPLGSRALQPPLRRLQSRDPDARLQYAGAKQSLGTRAHPAATSLRGSGSRTRPRRRRR